MDDLSMQPASKPFAAYEGVQLEEKNFGGAKTIGYWGGVMLLINNVAGPTVSLMPGLAQEAGWLAMVLVMSLIASLSAACGFLLTVAMRNMPGNQDFEERVEYCDLISYYFRPPVGSCITLTYHAYLILTLMTYIIQSAQVIDYVILDAFGCAPGLILSQGFVCGSVKNSVTPFGDVTVLSSSMLLIVAVCIPLAMQNLDDNVLLQWIAIIGFTAMAVFWLWFLASRDEFPQPVAVMTCSQGSLWGTVLFNFAFMSALPSWLNEKRPEVPVGRSFAVALGYVVVVYSAIGIVGAMAFHPYFSTDQNLFSKLNESGSQIARLTVAAYPILQNFTSIPVLAIFIRYNLQSFGLGPRSSLSVAFILPWVLSIPCYTGHGFDAIAAFGGLATSTVINFAVPMLAALLSWRHRQACVAERRPLRVSI
eukprot:TRINITY_DN42569_c0_g1_i1.p1 TRINITY_DN42569_c0_g1~~TRINITY_DN42569_c0_g1_i1.p1  ORF type:complete len:449 (+),score=62.94 TRINITY_DN42569_c0_g1_i1:83-1348(+)